MTAKTTEPLFAEIVDREDVGVIESRHGPGLPLEAGERVGVLGDRRGKHLDRDLAAEPLVARPVHFSHSARAKRREDFVRTEAGARGQAQSFSSARDSISLEHERLLSGGMIGPRFRKEKQ